MKQTAVEWLFEQMNKNTWYDESNYPQVNIGVIDFNQAKEIEKEQQGYSEEDMKLAFCNGGELDYSALTSTEFGTKLLNKWFEQYNPKLKQFKKK